MKLLTVFFLCAFAYFLLAFTHSFVYAVEDISKNPRLKTPHTIVAFTFNEYRGNVNFDEQDHGMGGWTICLTGKNIKNLSCQTSDSTGFIYWENIPAGEYQLVEKISEKQKEAGWALRQGDRGYIAKINETGTTQYLLDGKDIPIPYFGNRLAEIHGHTFYDNNQNGSFSEDEKWYGGFQAYLDLNNNGVLENERPWTGCVTGIKVSDCIGEDSEPFLVSDGEDGSFHFRNLPKGTYIVRVVPKTGWKFTGSGEDFGENINKDFFTKTVNGWSPYPWLNFGFSPTADPTQKISASANSSNTAINPKIYNVQASKIDNDSVEVSWNTNLNPPFFTRIFYDTISHAALGLKPIYANNGYLYSTPGTNDSTKLATHSASVRGLDPQKTYYYRIVLTNSQYAISDPEESFKITSLTPIPSPSPLAASPNAPIYKLVNFIRTNFIHLSDSVRKVFMRL